MTWHTYFCGQHRDLFIHEICDQSAYTVCTCPKFLAVCCSVLQSVAVCCSALQCVAVCCSMLQCVAVCCSVLDTVGLHDPHLPQTPATHRQTRLGQRKCSAGSSYWILYTAGLVQRNKLRGVVTRINTLRD